MNLEQLTKKLCVISCFLLSFSMILLIPAIIFKLFIWWLIIFIILMITFSISVEYVGKHIN